MPNIIWLMPDNIYTYIIGAYNIHVIFCVHVILYTNNEHRHNIMYSIVRACIL